MWVEQEKILYNWLFSIEDEQGESHYVDSNGEGKYADDVFVGTRNEAFKEGERRADLWEEKHGGFLLRVTCERRGPAPDGEWHERQQ